MSLTLLHPWYALLLGLLPVIWYIGRRSTRLQRSLRCMLIASLVFAIMQPVLIRNTQQIHHIILLDQSNSVATISNADTLRLLKQQVASFDGGDIQLLQFGGKPLVLDDVAITYLNSDRSSLSQLTRQALAMIPLASAGDITLLSDGLATDPHWSETLAALQLRDIPLNLITLPSTPSKPFIAQVTQAKVRVGEIAKLTVEMEGLAQAQQDLLLQVVANGQLIGEQRLQANQFNGRDSKFINLELPETKTAFTNVQLRLLDSVQHEPLEQRDLVLAAQPAYSILYASADAAAASNLQSLLGQGFKVDAVELPLSSDIDFSQYQAVMLDDLRAAELPEVVQKQLMTAVDGGTGLFYSGGDTAFAAGGMANQPLAEALPIKLQQQEQQREPSVSLAIVIDSSGSMKGRPLELAKQVARLAVKKLKPQDQVGIVEFYGTRQWAVPMQAVDHPEEIERAIGRLQAQGGSELFPAIQEAYFGLKNSHHRYRHILLITDAAVEEDNYQRLLRFIAQDQINVSTVLVGESSDGEQRMAELANWGKGRFYAIHNEFNMVEINLHRPSTQPQSGYRHGQFLIEDSQRHRSSAPALTGYSHVTAKAAAQVLWQEAKSGAPLVSRWRYGAGRVTAMMTEPLGKGTNLWRNWDGYGRWLGQQLTQTASQQQALQIRSERVFDSVDVTVEVAHRDQRPALEWKFAIAAQWQPVSLQQRAPGLYVGKLNIANSQPVLLQAQTQTHISREVNQSASDRYDELKVPQQQIELLSDVVRASGGHITDEVNKTIQTTIANKGLVALALYPWLLLFCLVLYFIEIIYRRMPRRRVVVGK